MPFRLLSSSQRFAIYFDVSLNKICPFKFPLILFPLFVRSSLTFHTHPQSSKGCDICPFLPIIICCSLVYDFAMSFGNIVSDSNPVTKSGLYALHSEHTILTQSPANGI